VEKLDHQPVGGLREAGFIENTEYLLVLGSQGRTIFNCQTGEKVERDRQDYYTEKWNFKTGLIEGIGRFQEKKIICGGFEYPDPISKSTSDNWQINISKEMRPDYKKDMRQAEVMYLVNNAQSKKVKMNVFHYSITRAYGFSKTGKSFVLTESDGLTIWIKDE
jgi:hypothetical protein